MHSAGTQKSDKAGGLLTMISTRIAKQDDIQFLGVHAGRILYVRLNTGRAPIHL